MLDRLTHQLLQLALAEDLGSGDVTSTAIIPEDATGTGSDRARRHF